jgi:hypothetical protein
MTDMSNPDDAAAVRFLSQLGGRLELIGEKDTKDGYTEMRFNVDVEDALELRRLARKMHVSTGILLNVAMALFMREKGGEPLPTSVVEYFVEKSELTIQQVRALSLLRRQDFN